jgi:hypothetical protein
MKGDLMRRFIQGRIGWIFTADRPNPLLTSKPDEYLNFSPRQERINMIILAVGIHAVHLLIRTFFLVSNQGAIQSDWDRYFEIAETFKFIIFSTMVIWAVSTVYNLLDLRVARSLSQMQQEQVTNLVMKNVTAGIPTVGSIDFLVTLSRHLKQRPQAWELVVIFIAWLHFTSWYVPATVPDTDISIYMMFFFGLVVIGRYCYLRDQEERTS